MTDPLTAAAEPQTGAMVALIPAEVDAARLAVDGGEPVEELHCTLMYLGEAADIPAEARQAIIDAVTAYVDGWPPVVADGFAISMFNPPGMDSSDGKQRDTCVVLGLSGDDLDLVHDMVGEAVDGAVAEAGLTLPDQHAPWHAHTTLIYTGDARAVAALADRVGPVTFDRVRVAFAGENTDIPLDAPHPDEVAAEGEESLPDDLAVAEFAGHMPAKLQAYWLRRLAPWGGPGSWTRCARALRGVPGIKDPKGACANLYKTATGRWPGADHHSVGGCDGCGPDFQTEAVMAEVLSADATLVEDVTDDECGDNFCRNPLHPGPCKGWKRGQGKAAPDAGKDKPDPKATPKGRTGSAVKGPLSQATLKRMTDEQIDNGIRMQGTDSPKGKQLVEERDRRKEERAGNHSVGADSGADFQVDGAVTDSDEDTALEDPLAAQPGEHFHAVMHVEGVTTGMRVFSEGALTWRQPPFAFHWQRGSSAHSGTPETVQVGNVTRVERERNTIHGWGPLDLRSADGVEYARKLVEGFARWVSIGLDESLKESDIEYVWPAGQQPGGDLVEGSGEMLFSEPQEMIFHAGRIAELSGVSIPAQAEATIEPTQALVDALAEMGVLTAPTADAGPLVAAGHIIEIPDVPPAWWFDEPTDVTPHGALTVTDEGRIYGYLAPANLPHRSYRDQRVTVPMKRVDYDKWMGGEAIVAGGGRVVAGPITMNCGHADVREPDFEKRRKHYDNSCSVAAQARIGENRHGVWIAGALLPGVTADQVTRMLACTLSGDWQPHRDRPGWQEFIAALLVPVGGFQEGRTAPSVPLAASVRISDGVLVASAVPVRFVHAGEDTAVGPDLRPVLERVARSIHRDAESRLSALRERVATRRGTNVDV